MVALPAETAEWVRRLPDIARYDGFEFYNLHNPRGFGDLLTGSRSIGTWVGLVGLVLAVGWLVGSGPARGDDRLVFAAAVFATLWGSPHTMTYEWALAVLPAVILWDVRPDRREVDPTVRGRLGRPVRVHPADEGPAVRRRSGRPDQRPGTGLGGVRAERGLTPGRP